MLVSSVTSCSTSRAARRFIYSHDTAHFCMLLVLLHASSKSEEVRTCGRVTAEPGQAALAAGADNTSDKLTPHCVSACCLFLCHVCSKSEEVGTCARITAEPGPSSLAAGADYTSDKLTSHCVSACCLFMCHVCSKAEEVGTCARVTAEPGPASLAAGAANVLQLSQSGNPRPPRDASTCDARARFNYKVAVGPVNNDKCGAYQVRLWQLTGLLS
jgi:hypothetical protein